MNEALREQQFTLARHLRDPGSHPAPPGIEERRLKVYRDLFYGAIEGLLAGSFPVMRKTLGDERWHARVRDFYANYRSQTPLFTEIAEVFVEYLEGITLDAPWQAELAHYEWVESALYLSDAEDPDHDPQGDLLDGEPLLSCVAIPLAYCWPVERIGPDFQPEQPDDAPTLLLVHRDADFQVRFARISGLAYRLLAGLEGSGRASLEALAAEWGADPQEVLEQGRRLLEDLREQGVILGTRR